MKTLVPSTNTMDKRIPLLIGQVAQKIPRRREQEAVVVTACSTIFVVIQTVGWGLLLFVAVVLLLPLARLYC